ncbi:FG-GAP repeat domain-containing protein [Streptomyces sp. NPDC012421]|uniref:FG-GAP repeat domain-containing protein n=1 Tax=Streptomyces sp. NPDC012421 TaxID=3364832 RepID=UPI0036EB42F5
MRRTIALGGTAALLVAGLVSGASTASADDWYPMFDIEDRVIQPGGWPAEVNPNGVSYDDEGFDGTLVYAFSKAPLTDPTWAQGGLPAGVSVEAENCQARAGTVGVYTCPVSDEDSYPGIDVHAAEGTPNNTTVHYGFVYVPRGGDLAAAAKTVQTVDLKLEDGRHAARTVTVKTVEHVAQNTIQLTTPPVAVGTTVTHTAKVHAVDKGRLAVFLEPGEGMRHWEEGELKVGVTGVRQSSGTTECEVTKEYLSPGGVSCEIDPGAEGPVDVLVSYTVKADPSAAAWKLNTGALYEVFSSGDNPQTWSEFSVQSSRPVPTHYAMVSRDKSGLLHWHPGTGRATKPFREWTETVGRGWGIYNAVTKLAPITSEAAGGGVVARDASGVLWSYRTTGLTYEPLSARVRVGSGWGIYNQLVGVGDVSGDGRPDMIGRDASGVLWLYKGTTSATAPFATRLRVGGGWGIYNQFTGAGDLTGDGRADLVARDAAGVLWLYPATGKAEVPYATRVRVGSGWQGYPLMSSPGDLTDDGRADLVARDSAGNAYLYQGTGKAAAPYSGRVKISLGEVPASLNALF